MCLINTETFLFEEFHTDIPPYAILSHRWEEEEVAFADYPAQLTVLAIGGTRKKGSGKIEFCAKQARLDGLAYCWVDTYCIDKSNSAELTEAINSMYAWYRDSAVCYIYLSDVDVSGEEHQTGKGTRPVASEDFRFQTLDHKLIYQLASSRWFSRGWTLQELLAPAICIFYDVGWVPLLKFVKHAARTESDRYGVGPKPRLSLEDDVKTAIEEMTGINSKTMTDFSPTSRDFSIAVKISWASNRKTTRAEDMTYCLMGIFDVNMPHLYGEGGPKAFQRLQEEIIKHTDDQSIFHWRDLGADRSAFRGLLARSPADFSESSIAGFSGDPVYIRANGDAHPTSTYDKTFGMTNRELRISLAIVSSGREWEERVMRGNDEVVAILGCGTRPGRKFCIILARLADDGHYARVDAHVRPSVINLSSLSPSQVCVRDIFVRQEPVVHQCYKSSRMTAVKFGSDPGFRIASACPEETWDAKARRISPIDSYFARGMPGRVGDLKPVMLHDPGLVDLWLRKGPFNDKKPLATAVVHVVDLFPLGVPSIDFTISLWWKSRREGDEGPYAINIQFDQVRYTGIATHPSSQQQTGWTVSPKSIVRTSLSWILRIGVREKTLLVEGNLVLGAWFTWERISTISGMVDQSRDFVHQSGSLVR